jgi:hypothetical protein
MKKIIIISLVVVFLFGTFALSQQKAAGIQYAVPKSEVTNVVPVEKSVPSSPSHNLKQPPPYNAPANAVGKYTNMYSFYDYQNNGGSMDYIEMNPTNPNLIHTILMASNDSLNVSSSRRTWVNISTNGGTTWGATPSVVPGIRSGYPSMTLHPYLGIAGYPAVVANHADPDGDANIASFMYFEQTDGGLNFTEGYGPGLWGTDVTDQPIWPHVAASSNGNTIMMAGRSTAGGQGVVTYDVNGIFSSWTIFDTSAADGASGCLAVGPSGRVAAIVSDFSTVVDGRYYYFMSRDHGVTWGPEVFVDSANEAASYGLYWGGRDAIFLDTTLYIAYVGVGLDAEGNLPYVGWRIHLYDNKTNTITTPIDSTSFPLLRRTMVGGQSQGNHTGTFNFPSLGKNVNGTKLFLACDAFIQDAVDVVPGVGSFSFSDVIYTATTDGGTTWADVKNLTRTNDLDERYVSVSNINPGTGIGTDSNYMYLVFHEKATAGTNVQDGRDLRMLTQKFLKVNTDFKPVKDLSIAGVQVVNYTGIHAVGVDETVKVKINNGGTETNPTSVTLTYKAGSAPASSGDGTSQTFTPTWDGKYADVVFSSTYLPVNPGANLTIFVKVFYTGDQDADNDVGSKTVFVAYNKDILLWSLEQLTVPSLSKLPTTQLQAKVRNYGSQSTNVYSVNWTVGGVAQTPAAMPVLGYAEFDSTVLNYNPGERGTKRARIWLDMSGDSARSNDSASYYLRSYPQNAFAIAYDSLVNTPDSYWGRDHTDSSICAAVRFTPAQDMKLSAIDAIYTNAYNNVLYSDSMIVYVWAAGVSDTAPGAILWKKKISGDYIKPQDGQWYSIPVDANINVLAGQDIWCGIQFSRSQVFPMGWNYYTPSITWDPNNPTIVRAITSYFTEDSVAVWNGQPAVWAPTRSVAIGEPGGKVEGRFVMRAIGVPTVPGGTFAVNNAWNMISIPVNTTELKTELFPTATSSAFKFVPGTGYVAQTTLGPGPGYWLKFGEAQTVTAYGSAITNLEIPVVAGWNMIGSISASVATSAVTTTGSASIASPFYAYSAGYVTTTSIIPGKGLWVKSGGAGNLVLASTLKPNANNREPDITAFNKITIADKNGNKQSLYFGENTDGKFPVSWFEMPPSAPEGIFDVRYASQRMLEAYPVDANDALEYAISVSGAQFPITVSYEIASRTKTFVINNGSANNVLNGDKGSVIINNLKSGNLILKIDALDNIPVDYNLGQNYPNPFNPSTTFEFAMPKIAKVEIVVYDILGSKVATLFDGVKAVGYHKVEWNGKNSEGSVVPSGVYFVKMTSDGFSAVKKALMLK